MIPHRMSVFRAAISTGVGVTAYVILLGDLMRQANVWHRQPLSASTQLNGALEYLTASPGDLEPQAEFDLACLQPDYNRAPIIGDWETDRHGEARRVVFRGAPAVQSPGTSEAEVQLFGPSGDDLGRWWFWPGPGFHSTNVSYWHHPRLQRDVIVIEGEAAQGRPKQYFAFS